MIPEPTIRRLPWYLAYVSLLSNQGCEYVSSTRLAEKMDVDASQIAKDLSYLDIKGKTRIGYDVKLLEKALAEFLGFGKVHNAVIIGVGSLGSALIRDKGLHHYGLNIVAGFDTDATKVGTKIEEVEIFPIDKIADIRAQLDVKVCILTVPFEIAQSVADTCMEAGVSAIWNFTPCRIRVADGVVLQNTSIYSNLAIIYNRLEHKNARPEYTKR